MNLIADRTRARCLAGGGDPHERRRTLRRPDRRARFPAASALLAGAAFLAGALLAVPALGQAPYFPERHDWQTRSPAEAGFDEAALDEAVEFAVASESDAPRDLALNHELTFAREPFGRRIGPTTVRGALSGIVVRGGFLVKEWGPTEKVDMTFSVSKTFLSTTVGLLYDDGLIASVDDRVGPYMPTDELFGSEHNRTITWDHLLRQTSDWQGELFGKPDWADRPVGDHPFEYPDRPMHEPGTHYKYNDVRVNLLALAALEVVREPLPVVLRYRIMDPIGASNRWRWHGYENSWVMIDGRKLQSVSGGGHWGGGMHLSARDLARFGLLYLRMGNWNGRQLISEEWIGMARTPGAVNPGYGHMNWFLNHPVERDGESVKSVPAAPDSAVTFRGAGSNIVYVDWENDLVVVVRWIEGGAVAPFLGKVLAALE